MTDLHTAAKLALEALEDVDGINTETECVTIDVGDAITTLRTAIAQCEARATEQAAVAEPHKKQEPVAWIFKPNRELLWPHEVERKNPLELNEYVPLYTIPPAAQRQPLTEADMTHEYRKGFIAGQIDMRDRPEEQRQPLTDDEMWSLWNAEGSDYMSQQEAMAFARAIEAAHGIGEKK